VNISNPSAMVDFIIFIKLGESKMPVKTEVHDRSMSKKIYMRLAIVDLVIPNEDIKIVSVIATDSLGNTHETEVDFFVGYEDENGEEILDENI